MTYLPPGIAPDLAAEQWHPTLEEEAERQRRAMNTPRPQARIKPTESQVKREPPGPNAEAWLRKYNGPYREARERQERPAPAGMNEER